jgi:hypothetical protein
MWFVGIDWADQHHDLAVVDSQGQLFATKRVDHSVDGVGELVAYIRAIATAPEEVACLIETAHGLLITALLEAGLAVYPVHPEMVNRLRPPSGVKTDQLDALLLARTGRNLWPDLHRLRPDSPLVSTLRLLTRDQDDLVAEQTRLINRLIACLKEYYPVVLSCFTSMGQRVALSFLQAYPTVADAQAASRDDLLTLFAQARHAQVEQRACASICRRRRSDGGEESIYAGAGGATGGPQTGDCRLRQSDSCGVCPARRCPHFRKSARCCAASRPPAVGGLGR